MNKPINIRSLWFLGKYGFDDFFFNVSSTVCFRQIYQVKEVKFRLSTDDGDYNVKLRNLVKFLEDGDKTKITLRFRGRELAHQEIGVRMLERLKADLEPYGQVEQFPKMKGRQMVMVLSPVKKK